MRKVGFTEHCAKTAKSSSGFFGGFIQKTTERLSSRLETMKNSIETLLRSSEDFWKILRVL
jgi:hypothetical protein